VLNKGKEVQAIKKERLHFDSIFRMSDTEWRCETNKEMVVFKVVNGYSLFMGKGEREYDLLNMMPIAKVLNNKINFIDIMMAIDCTMDMDNMWDN
jgi:hypothetical protein